MLGAALAASALQLAEGGYTVVLDGHFFPDRLDGLLRACMRRRIPLHYAVLRADLATCLTRIDRRRPGDADNAELVRQQHARSADLGVREAYAIDATKCEALDVAAALRGAIDTGLLLVASDAGSPRA